MTTLIPIYDEIGNVQSITLYDGVEATMFTPDELSALRFAQVEADALRSDRAGLLRKIRELESLLAAARNLRSAVLAVNGIADAETALFDAIAALERNKKDD